jgi:hypothetical protein
MMDADVGLIVLPPIPTKNLTAADVDDLAKRTREAMLEELVRITERARGEGVKMGAVTGTSTGASVEHGRKRVEGKVRQEL